MHATLKQIRTREKYNNKQTIQNKLLIVSLSILIFSLLFALKNSIVKASNYINKTDTFDAPIQVMLYPQESFIKNMNGCEVTFTKLASYSISGRVVEEQNYSSGFTDFIEKISCKSYYNEIASKDVAIAYGPLALDENNDKMTYLMTGTRSISYKVNDESIYDSFESMDEICKCVTNNHLIPANDEIEKLIQQIEKDDYVQISGYLVNVIWRNNSNKYMLCSSLSRDDLEENACEIIYVEDIKWIQNVQ